MVEQGEAELMDWQPIETAPQDNVPILGKLLDGQERKMMWWPLSREWCGSFGNIWLSFNDENQPTHWMPLPEPPK